MIGNEFLKSAIKRLREYKSLGDKTLEQLKASDLHWQPDESTNSIAIIVKHLHGNMKSRWTNFLTEDGEKEWRQRDEEFVAKHESDADIIGLWEEGWTILLDTLETLSTEDLLKTVTIRTQPLTVIDAINRQLAHYSYHIGQIVQLGKWIKKEEWQSLSIPKGASQKYNFSLRQGIKS